VKDISDIYDRNEFSPDGVKNYIERDKMNKAICAQLTDLVFQPALKEGRNVKSWKDVKGVNVLATPDGKFQIEMPDFLSGRMFGSKDEYLIVADEMPEIIGGMYSIQKNIRYPELAKRAGIEGKVYVLAFIDEQGDVVNAQIIKGIGAGCDEAALHAVKLVKFKPGRREGKPVKPKYQFQLYLSFNIMAEILPVKFCLKYLLKIISQKPNCFFLISQKKKVYL
jgi:TonB family protein